MWWYTLRNLALPEVGQDGINQLKGSVDLLADLGTSEYNLSRHENQKNDLRFPVQVSMRSRCGVDGKPYIIR
jgi:hypothetical protein